MQDISVNFLTLECHKQTLRNLNRYDFFFLVPRSFEFIVLAKIAKNYQNEQFFNKI